MKILVISQRYPPEYLAGQEIMAQNIARQLCKNGHNVTVFTSALKSNISSYNNVNGVGIHRLLISRHWFRCISQFFAFMFKASVTKMDYDLVHCHCISPATLAVAIVAKMHKVPVLCQPSLGGQDGEIALARSFFLWPLIHKVLLGISMYAVLDNTIEIDLLNIHIPNSRLVRVKNGSDPLKFKSLNDIELCQLKDKLGWHNHLTALFVGQLIPRKGIDLLCAAWPIVKEKIPNAQLIVVGEGFMSDQIMHSDNYSNNGLVWIKANKNIEIFMQAADVLVLPSREESFGLVLLEAMMCGTPIVCTRVGIANQLEIDEQAGFVVASENTQAIATALIKILSSIEMRYRFKVNAIRLSKPYTIEAVVENFEIIYQQLLTSSDNQQPRALE